MCSSRKFHLSRSPTQGRLTKSRGFRLSTVRLDQPWEAIRYRRRDPMLGLRCLSTTQAVHGWSIKPSAFDKNRSRIRVGPRKGAHPRPLEVVPLPESLGFAKSAIGGPTLVNIQLGPSDVTLGTSLRSFSTRFPWLTSTVNPSFLLSEIRTSAIQSCPNMSSWQVLSKTGTSFKSAEWSLNCTFKLTYPQWAFNSSVLKN